MDNYFKKNLCCVECEGKLEFKDDCIKCLDCSSEFKIKNDIPLMFSSQDCSNNLMKEYIECYEKIAKDDLNDSVTEIETLNERYKDLKNFIGNTKDKAILDIGSSQGLFLKTMEGQKVAFDISLNYLREAKKINLLAVGGLAEALPFKSETFDIVICSDILEHVLAPEKVIKEVYKTLKSDGSFIIEVPFEEDLLKYKIYEGKYKFTHLRNFNDKTLFKLLDDNNFRIVRKKYSMYKASLSLPIIRRLLNALPIKSFKKPIFVQLEAKKKNL
ncbi:MAG: class I SAM-dependent methyltransferase [Candidatus Pacebacteria bacterium]|nr:class I SAM-dependent methyltransferase [Candidatus Paceibacterota bacterium]